jgi:uncharacterized protein YndB with AHSA1/START domain
VNASDVVAGPVTVRVSRQFASSPARIFDAWFQPACLASYLSAGAAPDILRAHFEPRVGGRFLLAVRGEADASLELRGEYLEIERPERLVFAIAADDDRSSRHCVTVELASLGGGCLVALLHEMDMRYAADRPRVQRAWAAALRRLADLEERPSAFGRVEASRVRAPA